MTRRLSLHKVIVLAQVATCTVLLAAAALLVQTLHRMRSMDAGFDQDHVVTFTLDPSMKGYSADQALRLGQQMLAKVRALPSVAAASIANRALMRGTGFKASFARAGETVRQEDFLNSSTNSVTPGYFDTMGIHLVKGRDFTPFDAGREEGAPTKVIVNQAFVRHFFPNEDPIGKRIGIGPLGSVAAPKMEIIGVVGNARYRSLREDIHPTLYSLMSGDLQYSFSFEVRTRQRPEAVVPEVRNILRSVDPDLPLIEVHTLRSEIDSSLWQERLLAELSSIFGLIAVLLASIGLYGALDYAVKMRTREIGVRAALGAEPARIARLIGGQALPLVAAGIALGLAAHAVASSWFRSVLYGVRPSDPAALGWTVVLVVAAAAAASLPPILRAIRIDPASALRQE